MGHVERGEKNLSLSTMVRISNALRIGLPQLLAARKRQSSRMVSKPTARPPAPRFGFAEMKHVFTELRMERNALRQAVRDLVRLTKTLNGDKPK